MDYKLQFSKLLHLSQLMWCILVFSCPKSNNVVLYLTLKFSSYRSHTDI